MMRPWLRVILFVSGSGDTGQYPDLSSVAGDIPSWDLLRLSIPSWIPLCERSASILHDCFSRQTGYPLHWRVQEDGWDLGPLQVGLYLYSGVRIDPTGPSYKRENPCYSSHSTDVVAEVISNAPREGTQWLKSSNRFPCILETTVECLSYRPLQILFFFDAHGAIKPGPGRSRQES